MQVKKFEARSMKDAIQMIKNQLGPEAIILSAKDIGGGYGIKGQSSVEVTAAVSETTLRKKQLAEKKLREKDLARFQGSSARIQRDFINKVFERGSAPPDRSITATRYIDIDDQAEREARLDSVNFVENSGVQGQGPLSSSSSHSVSGPISANQRIKSAAQEALAAAYMIDEKKEEEASRTSKSSRNSGSEDGVLQKDLEINQLKVEVNQLRKVIEQFQRVPQTLVGQHPGASSGLPYELSFMYEKLVESGINDEVVIQILQKAQSSLTAAQMKKRALVDAWVVKHVMDTTKISEDPFGGRYHVFVGLTGQGKTSSLVKMASDLTLRQKKRVAIVSCDTSKVASAEQLRIYAQILNVPFAQVTDKKHWSVIEQQLKDIDHILVDAPGMGLKSTEQCVLLNELLPESSSRKIHFVISALAKDADIVEVANNYRKVNFDDVIFTRLDETVQHGVIYNFIHRFNVPIHSFGIGPAIPEDFEMATKERLVDLIFKLTKFRKERG